MLRSMTGFGLVQSLFNGKNITIEIKSLNSKFFDLTLRVPRAYSEFESEIRNLLSDRLERGKISLSIDVVKESVNFSALNINQELFGEYFNKMKSIADSVGVNVDAGIFQMAMNAPDVQQSNQRDVVSQEEKDFILRLLLEACEKCDHFRQNEGAALESKLQGYIHQIDQELTAVIQLDPQRIEKIRNRLKGGLLEWFGQGGFDANRLEQEMIYYIERLDIQEERVRLKTHLNYFLKNMNEPKSSGRKLSFIGQEIGREINTIGSKASDAAIQIHVVTMKEELEKIKEQLSNIL